MVKVDTKNVLVVFGAILIAAGVWSWYGDKSAGTTTVTETYGAEKVKQESEPVETTEVSETTADQSLGRGNSSKTVTTGPTETRARTRPAKKRIVTTTTPPRSEALTLGLLGFGSAFLLAGAFYERISTIKFPGGEVTLAEGTKKLEHSVAILEETQAKLGQAITKLTHKVAQLQRKQDGA